MSARLKVVHDYKLNVRELEELILSSILGSVTSYLPNSDFYCDLGLILFSRKFLTCFVLALQLSSGEYEVRITGYWGSVQGSSGLQGELCDDVL